tara:strand:+ start:73 stop:660 length:588 start_codon:yes stop_codon:yes gene_type:complete
MIKKYFIYFFLSFLFPTSAFAHMIIGRVGFFDGLSHPVLGLDHLLAMISVGIISAQIGGRAIWTVPSAFVVLMIAGGIFGFSLIVKNFYFVEIGIILSVILLGLVISIEKKIPTNFIMVFVGLFGVFHGIAHGLEIPAAASPILFILGFIIGTATLHIFGVVIGHYAIKTSLSLNILRLTGICFAIYGIYLLIGI